MSGVFAMMLHGHIPYCRKSGVWPAGEEWLLEAINENYIPLLRMLRRIQADDIRPHLMIGVVPILAEQLADEYMNRRFGQYMEDKIARAEADVARFRGDPARRRVARYWHQRFETHYRAYREEFDGDLLGVLRSLQDAGTIEVLTSAATHGFLPLLERDSAVFAQVRLGVETYRQTFGRDPRGFWLPECAYRPQTWTPGGRRRRAIDEWLADQRLDYFFVEDVGIARADWVENRHGETVPTTFRGYRLPSGVAVFGRNGPVAQQVWSAELGYPGDPHYLDFHSKDDQSGLHYWQVTGREAKAIYDPQAAAERVERHAGHFVWMLKKTLAEAESAGLSTPIVVAPFDCELFGHWWHEGVDWLDRVYRLLARSESVECLGLGQFIDRHGADFSTITMAASTWGLNSDFTVWQNPEHDWIWPPINASSKDMERAVLTLAQDADGADPRHERILRQMARELLLMQGSDWPFLLFTEQAKQYANQRFHNHHQRFQKLAWAAKDPTDPDRISEADLREIESVDCPWPEIDYRLFGKRR